MRQTRSYYHNTLQPYRSPDASSSTRQHHERETAYPWGIGAYNRHRGYSELGVRTNIPRRHRINHHQPPREKNYNNPLSARCSSVRCAGSSIQFSSNYACLLSPFADSCTRPSPRSVSAVRAALPGLFLVCMLPIPF